jgi:hypothetical protein
MRQGKGEIFMMQSNNSQGTQQSSNSALERLNVFVGEWNIEITSMSFEEDKNAVVRGRASFEWIEGGAFLLQRSEVPNTDFPRPISIIGPDDSAETYSMLYFDSRGVSRFYQMSFSRNVWKLWRDFPGFSQRFIGTFNDQRNIITARWEKSDDGSNWELDFKLTYTKVS